MIGSAGAAPRSRFAVLRLCAFAPAERSTAKRVETTMPPASRHARWRSAVVRWSVRTAWVCCPPSNSTLISDGRADCARRRQRVHRFASLQSPQRRIHAIAGNQFDMRAAFDDASVVEHVDGVGVPHRGQPMRDDQRGAPVAADARASAGWRLRSRCRRRSWLRRAPGCDGSRYKRARQGDALALSAGELRAALADRAVVAVRQRIDEGVRLGGARGCFDARSSPARSRRRRCCRRSCRR